MYLEPYKGFFPFLNGNRWHMMPQILLKSTDFTSILDLPIYV